ncbi:MAG: hypothetical protein WA210_12670 [Burkholderiaceae bacterium]
MSEPEQGHAGRLTMSKSRIATLTWTLIFAGLLVLALGLTVLRTERILGGVLIAASIVAVLGGAVLIWARSRMPARDDG